MRRFAAFAAALSTMLPTLAQAAEAPCLTPSEFTAVSTYAMPAIIDGTVQRCGSTLSPDAFLRRDGRSLAQRYAVLKPRAWPGAKAAFLKISAGKGGEMGDMLRGMPDSSLQPMLDAFVSGAVSQQLPLQRCGAVNRVVELLAPLPPENTAELIALATGLGSQAGQARFGMITICSA